MPTCWINGSREPGRFENPQTDFLIEARARDVVRYQRQVKAVSDAVDLPIFIQDDELAVCVKQIGHGKPPLLPGHLSALDIDGRQEIDLDAA